VLGGCNIANLSTFDSVNKSLLSKTKVPKDGLKKWKNQHGLDSGFFYSCSMVLWYMGLNEHKDMVQVILSNLQLNWL